ncbi:indolepyruvate ferredoxin oxidoreductase family protein [Williamsia sp. CHRR-6]|uniref:indolepyruvate ferredoxin oxidoreductase family protein n=1 Tax=Williamsia sp. CHRR-6 TaxID=2835871 RepID=UPI001BDA2DC6|nr:indolepyruvate ferredoxin oxidoreductase family protein [Williamsia sp. CHRR-6]MBT0566553.1 indolepyruvate ferredoxin oxidoreductase family protein [Williamsia sp. CHRR-6]
MTLAPDRPASNRQSSEPFSLDDRYTRTDGSIYLSGIAALVRMVADRARLDRAAGLRTGSFISGYEGSPLAGYDLEIARRRRHLDGLDVVHRPALNEELAATAIMGSQVAARVAHLAPDADGHPRDGVVGYWYGKAPGLDRATDALRHANLIGTHHRGGAVALVGDDPGAKSSTVPCASEMSLADLYLPTLYPAESQDILDFGVHAALMSRVSGLWTALKISAHVADGASTAVLAPDRISPVYGDLGTSPHIPSGKLLGANLMELEQNQLTIRKPRALEYARLNGLNRIVVRSGDDRIGIVAAGKTYLDVREGLRLIGISDADLRALGIRILKLGMVYPFERSILDQFVDGLDEVIVVEEKRDFIETMMREILFDRARAGTIGRIVGKEHEDGSTLFSRFGELDVDAVTVGLAQRLSRHPGMDAARTWLDRRNRRRVRIDLPLAVRSPFFCSGCPHNSATKVSPDTLVGAGIGCHAMVLLMDPAQVGDITGVTQMGGEGTQWLGMAPFVDEKHFVQNLGDGTFMHSGSLALRASVAAGSNVTYKLLYNGTVAMTGGQDAVGARGLPELAALLQAEGVARIVITSDDPKRTAALGLPSGVQVRHRDDTLAVQRELAAVAGVTVLIHDQHCAAEKRRKRKRGDYPVATQRVMINERICEGCGDCGEKSSCLSVHPVATEFGRKTRIDQSSCNVDLSCLNGDCPSFVTVTPGQTPDRTGTARAVVADLAADAIPAPRSTALLPNGFRLRVTGIGGTGVVTVNQILATAAVIDGHDARTVDMTGLAQKGGAVVSDLKVTAGPTGHRVEQAAKIATGDCDLYLACDPLVATDPVHLKVATADRTVAVVSTSEIPTGAMVVDTSVGFPAATAIHQRIDENSSRAVYLDPAQLSTALFGDEQSANMMMVGAAVQTGSMPISVSAIEQAIEVNGVAVDANIQAFRRGRQVVADPESLRAAIAALHPADTTCEPSAVAVSMVDRLGGLPEELRDALLVRTDELIAYQDQRYARRYVDDVARVLDAERVCGTSSLSLAVARNLFKLMAYKDEYEVARLTCDPAFSAQVAEQFGDDAKVAVRLHPPTLRAMGMRNKLSLGGWARPALVGLARAKRLRGTRFDPFGRAQVRRTERDLIVEYRGVVDGLIEALASGAIDRDRLEAAVALAELPDMVRGYESIKMANVERYRDELSRKRDALGV